MTVGTLDPNQPAAPIEELMIPGQPIQTSSLDREAETEAVIDFRNSWLVSDRQQLTEDGQLVSGYWLVTLAEVEHSSYGATDLAVAVGFERDLDRARAALAEAREFGETSLSLAALRLRGYVEPNEAPVTVTQIENLDLDVLPTLSVGQLVNLADLEPRPVYPGFLILIDGVGLPGELEPIRIAIQTATVEVNWLTAFYAIEWTIFGGFAFYVWWRLVTDARLRSVTKS